MVLLKLEQYWITQLYDPDKTYAAGPCESRAEYLKYDLSGSARDYFNEGTKDLAQRHDWRWLIKSSTITTADGTKTYSLAADVLKPLMFVHTTDDVTMAMVDIQEMIQADPDNDEEGASRFVVVNGINSSTGYW